MQVTLEAVTVEVVATKPAIKPAVTVASSRTPAVAVVKSGTLGWQFAATNTRGLPPNCTQPYSAEAMDTCANPTALEAAELVVVNGTTVLSTNTDTAE
jgi:hypothetical protein